MIRPPENQIIPKTIDPWTVSRDGYKIQGLLYLSDTRELPNFQEENASADVMVEGMIDEDNQSHLKGQITVTLLLECQRCLEKMQWQIIQDFDYVLIRDYRQETQIKGEYETLVCDDFLDLFWFVEEEILLAMPMIAKHENCSLPVQGNSVATGNFSETYSPFAILKTMIKEKP